MLITASPDSLRMLTSWEDKLKVQANAFTKAAQKKIEAAGGSCEFLENK